MKNITIKKQIIIPIFLFMLIGTVYAFTASSFEDEVTRSEVGVLFGNPPTCTGVGFCVVTPRERFEGASYDAMGTIIVAKDGKVSLQIDKKTISVAKAEEQFGGGGLFEIKEDLELMPEMNKRAAKGAAPPQIKKGNFPVTEDADFYTISF